MKTKCDTQLHIKLYYHRWPFFSLLGIGGKVGTRVYVYDKYTFMNEMHTGRRHM